MISLTKPPNKHEEHATDSALTRLGVILAEIARGVKGQDGGESSRDAEAE